MESLSLEKLTHKLVLLLALTTAQRVQSLAAIKISYLLESPEGFELQIPDLLKTSAPGVAQPFFNFKYYDKKELCVATHIKHYIAVTKPLRGSVDNLFICTRLPYKLASKNTISRWIRSTLVICGINADFKAHSTRHASTSAALKKGIGLDVIKKVAGWSVQSKTFFKFYNRPLMESNSEEFASALLQN